MKYKYKTNITKFVSSRDKIILDFCKNKKVLHIGAADSPFTEYKLNKNILLHKKIREVSKNILGIDLDKEAINFLKYNGIDDIIECDMNDVNKIDYIPDVIILGETIEHLMNLEVTFRNIKIIMDQNTLLLISTPNAYYVRRFVETLLGKENQHNDHKTIFSYGTLSNLLLANNLSAENVYFTFLDREFDGIRKKIEKKFCSIFIGFSETLLFVVKK